MPNVRCPVAQHVSTSVAFHQHALCFRPGEVTQDKVAARRSMVLPVCPRQPIKELSVSSAALSLAERRLPPLMIGMAYARRHDFIESQRYKRYKGTGASRRSD